MVRASEEKRGALRRKEGDENGRRRIRGRLKRRWLDSVRDDIKEKGGCMTDPHGGAYRHTLTYLT